MCGPNHSAYIPLICLLNVLQFNSLSTNHCIIFFLLCLFIYSSVYCEPLHEVRCFSFVLQFVWHIFFLFFFSVHVLIGVAYLISPQRKNKRWVFSRTIEARSDWNSNKKKNTHNIDIDSPISLCIELIRTAQIHRKKKRNPFVITMARNTHDYLTNLIIFVRAAMHRWHAQKRWMVVSAQYIAIRVSSHT